MKTEVKFRDLPEKVQGFISREFWIANDCEWHFRNMGGLEGLHKWSRWSDASDDERLAYAEWRYKDGVRYNYPDAPWLGDRTAQGLIRIGKDSNIVDDIFIIYEHEKNKWAEIISDPQELIREASPGAKQEFVKANPGMRHVEEPKAGDMVEYCFDEPNGWASGKYIGRHDFFVVWTGLKYIEARKIRLPQKSEVDSKAKELMLNYSGHNEIPAANYKHDSVMKMLTQAIKWGQANPDKI